MTVIGELMQRWNRCGADEYEDCTGGKLKLSLVECIRLRSSPSIFRNDSQMFLNLVSLPNLPSVSIRRIGLTLLSLCEYKVCSWMMKSSLS